MNVAWKVVYTDYLWYTHGEVKLMDAMTVKRDTVEDKSSMTFSFCGNYEVDALAVSGALRDFALLTTAIQESVFPNVSFRLSVRAVNPGSLEFEFVGEAIATAVQLFPVCSQYAKTAIEIILNLFKIKKFLSRKKAKRIHTDVQGVHITLEDGLTLDVPPGARVYFENTQIDSYVSSIVKHANDSYGVTGVRVDSDDDGMSVHCVEISRAEFLACSTPMDMADIDGVDLPEPLVSHQENAVLFIRQVDFSGGAKWRFRRENNDTISATIADADFLQRVRSGQQPISATMYLIADITSTTPKGPDGTPDMSKSTFTVTKVHKIETPGEGQIKLEL